MRTLLCIAECQIHRPATVSGGDLEQDCDRQRWGAQIAEAEYRDRSGDIGLLYSKPVRLRFDSKVYFVDIIMTTQTSSLPI